jgi:hypothetical protein
MMTHEPKCVHWKRQGAEQVTKQLSGLRVEQELVFWQKKTKRLRRLQTEAKKRLIG